MKQMLTLMFLIVAAVLLTAAAYSARHKARAPTDVSATAENIDLPDLQKRLETHVYQLAGHIGERNLWNFDELEKAADYIEGEFKEAGYEVKFQEIVVEGKTTRNLEVEIKGAAVPDEIVIIGAHYDSVIGSPGANDNGSGVAALLELARIFSGQIPRRTIRFVAFVNEEPPLYRTRAMGSRVYAEQSKKQKENIVAMISLETIGYYTESKFSQFFPFSPLRFFYPNTGNFVAFVANFSSRQLLRQCVSYFRHHSDFPAESLTAPGWLIGVDWSDHRSFWKAGYPAIMITDTALFRYPYYHASGDTPTKLNYPAMTRMVAGLIGMTGELAQGTIEPSPPPYINH